VPLGLRGRMEMMRLVMGLARIEKSRVATEISMDRGHLDLDTAWVRAEFVFRFSPTANQCMLRSD
jgi:hypothetical protein